MSSEAFNAKVDREADLRCRLARTRADELVACMANERAAVGQANTYNGALGECRQERKAAQDENVLVRVELARAQDETRKRWPKWVTYLAAGLALVFGAGAGYTAAKVAQ